MLIQTQTQTAAKDKCGTWGCQDTTPPKLYLKQVYTHKATHTYSDPNTKAIYSRSAPAT
ncbi:MAG: hypothetical protein ACP5MD_03480 [Verrucomicrobiia bacterium]